MDEDISKPAVPPVNPDTKKVIIGMYPNINGGVIYLDGQDEGLGYAPKEIEFTIKELFTPRELSVIKEGTISNDVYRIQSVEKINEKKTDTDLIFTYYDIIVDKLQEDGSYVQDQYITPVVDGVLDRTANEYVRLNYTIEEIPPPEPEPDSGIIFETNFPEDLSLFYEINGEDAKPIPSTSNQSQAIEFPVIDENNDDPSNRLKEIRVFSTSDLSEYTFNVFRLVRGDTITNFENEALVGLVEEELLTFQIEAVKTPPPPPIKKSITIFGDVVGENLIGYRLSNGVEGFVQSEEQQVEFEVSEETGNYIQFFNANNISYSDYVVNFDIINGNTNRQTNVFDFTEELTNNDVNISVVLTRATQTPPPNAPKLLLNKNNYEYNINDDSDLEITFTTENTDSIEYTISDIRRKVGVSSSIIISNFDFNKGIGQYKINLQPISEENGSGEIKSVVVNVVEKAYIPGPDIQNIDYPANIQAEDFIGFNVPFDIVVQSINTNYIDIYVSKVDSQFLVRKNASPNGKISLNISDIFKKSQINLGDIQDKVQFDLILIPYNSNGDSLTGGKEENISIFFDRGLRIKREDLVKDLRTAFEKEFDTSTIEVDSSKFLTHQLHLGNGDNRIISTWGVDSNTFDQDSLVLKLYEPLPPNISTEAQVWISKLQSIPIIDEIEMVDEEVKVCTPLQPNFNLDVVDPIGYEVIDTLVASGSTSSNELISTYISSSEFSLEDLNITFTTGSGSSTDYNWSDFVKYSSAEERVNNFWYKVRVLESYETDISNLSSGSSWTGSVEVLNEKRRIQTKINTLKSGFDSFEKYLYETTGSLSYPKNGLTPKPSTDQESQDWYYLTASVSAQQYDRNNYDSLVNNIPIHVKNNDNGQEFVLFFSMIGQHFDILWQYTKGINKARKLEHKKNEGIADELVYHMLESLGWNADMGVSSQFLWQYAFGNDENGNKTTSLSGKQRQQEIWRRLLNNLPYLLKHKGTKRALHAAMSCYGIPSSLLTIMEFGGPQASQQSSTTKTTFDDRTAALNFDTNAEIIVPWKVYTSGSYSDYPNSIEARLQTNIKEDQTIFESEGNWSVDIIKTTGSLAYLQMSISSSSDLEVVSSSTFPFFNEEYTQVVINRDFSGSNEVIELYAKEGFQGRIRNEASASITLITSNWESGNELKIGSGLSGSMDEFRLWRVPLNEQSIENHTLIPDAIDGNSYTASTEDLFFRLDFEHPRNLSVSSSNGIPSGSLLNVSVRNNYGESYATASNFPTESSYPYNYTVYDRTVVANVPSTGISFGQKFRFEEQVKIGDLSHKSRSTKRSFDTSPIDSDKLGLFFSPIKEINMDILKSLGNFNIDNYIGNPTDRYEDGYKDLKNLRNYYFDRFNLNLYEYIQLVRYIDKTIFTTLESLVPARAKVSKGLLIEPHLLERSKVQWKRPSALKNDFGTTIDINEDVILTSETNDIGGTIETVTDIVLSSDIKNYETNLVIDDIVLPSSEKLNYDSTIEVNNEVIISSSYSTFTTDIDSRNTTNLSGNITINSGSDMGGISISVDAKIEGNLSSEYESDAQIQAGLGTDSPFVIGFGLYGTDGVSIRTFYDKNNNLVQERVKVFQITEEYTQKIPQNINQFDPSLGKEQVSVTKTREKVTILPFTGSDGNESTDISEGGNITKVTPLNGYLPSHFRYVGDRTTGLENSFSKGSKQRASTTVDGSSPVETFTTNPNTLKVSDTGRGSGEPILEVT